MQPRLASGLLARALIQRAEAEGGFGTVIYKGDTKSGAFVLLIAQRGRMERIVEKILQSDGRYCWQESGPQAIENTDKLKKFLLSRKNFDPDLWVLELDVPDTQRFIDSLGTFD